MKVKLMIIFSSLFFGGAEKQFREIASRINKSRFDVYCVISGAVDKDENKKLNEKFIAENPDLHFHFLKNISIHNNKLRTFFAFNMQMNRILREFRPDIVISYNGIDMTCSYLCKKYGAKFFFSERESGNRGKSKLERYRFFLKPAVKVICNSKSAKRYYLSNNIKAVFIANGIDVEKPIALEKHEGINILIPARIARVKNQEVVIEAMNILSQYDINLTIIGKVVEDDYKEYLQQITEKYQLTDKINFLAYTTNIAEEYKKSDLVILPSFLEGTSNVILESYMYGRICIISDIPMNRDAANENQLFFDPKNAQELSEKIVLALNEDPIAKERTIADNYLFVSTHYDMDNMVRTYEKEFLQSLSN